MNERVTLPEPERIAKLPHYKGLPVTAVTVVIDDIPNFRAVDPDKIWKLKEERKCGICGDPLDYWIAFMVSAGEIESKRVYESPSHEECLRYAFQACPWLYYSKYKYSNPEIMKIEGFKFAAVHPDRKVINERPDMLAIYICNGYKNIVHKGVRVCKVSGAKKIEWFKGH
jgi:hypothetical protein